MRQGRMAQSMPLAPGGAAGPTSMGEAGPQYAGTRFASPRAEVLGPGSFITGGLRLAGPGLTLPQRARGRLGFVRPQGG